MSIRESISYFPTSDATRFTSIILIHSLFHLISGNDVSGEQSRGATDTGGSHRGGRSLFPKKKASREKKKERDEGGGLSFPEILLFKRSWVEQGIGANASGHARTSRRRNALCEAFHRGHLSAEVAAERIARCRAWHWSTPLLQFGV